MRGANPIVECPRCNATFPPTAEALATCARCGLVFPPHEVLHRPPMPANVLALASPAHLRVHTDGDTTFVISRLSRAEGVGYLVAALVCGALCVGEWSALAGFIVLLIGFGLVSLRIAVALLFGHRTVEVSPRRLAITFGPYALRSMRSRALPLHQIIATEVREVTRNGRRRFAVVARLRDVEIPVPLVESHHQDTADYFSQLLGEALKSRRPDRFDL